MTCTRPDLREKLELYVLKQLPPDQMKEIQHHLLECDECEENFEQQVPLAGALEHEERQKHRLGDDAHGGHGAPAAPEPEVGRPLPAGWTAAALVSFAAFAAAIAAVVLDARRLPDPKEALYGHEAHPSHGGHREGGH